MNIQEELSDLHNPMVLKPKLYSFTEVRKLLLAERELLKGKTKREWYTKGYNEALTKK